MTATSRPEPKNVRVKAAIVVILVMLLVFELGARVVFHLQDSLFTSSILPSKFIDRLDLDPYEEIAPNQGLHWRLKPGYSSNMQQLVNEKAAANKSVATKPDAGKGVALQINSRGFRGHELRDPPGDPRVLMLGDSVTFGIPFVSYPQAVEDRLSKCGFNIEVINAGVEGYSVRNHLVEFERYLSTDPDYVTILIGWNDLFSRSQAPSKWENWFKFVWLIRKSWRGITRLTSDAQSEAQKLYAKPKNPDRGSPEIHEIRNTPSPTLSSVRHLVAKFKQAGVNIVILTLPGLYTMTEPISERALEIGHLPSYTENPYVLAQISETFNQGLREIAKDENVELIDLAEWSKESLVPRHEYFRDSVHLTADGLMLAADFISKSMRRFLGANTVSKRKCHASDQIMIKPKATIGLLELVR